MKIPAVSRVRSKSPTFSPILLQRVPLIFPKKIIIFKIEEFSAVFLRQKLSSTVKMVPSHKNILIFSSPKKKIFSNQTEKFLTIPHSREPHAQSNKPYQAKNTKSTKKVEKGKNCSLKFKKHKIAELLTKTRK